MKVKEFLKWIDLSGTEYVTLIIPIEEKSINGIIKNVEDCFLSDKVILNSDEYSIMDIEKYNSYGINPTFIGNINSSYYNKVNVKKSNDGYNYITDESEHVWIVIG